MFGFLEATVIGIDRRNYNEIIERHDIVLENEQYICYEEEDFFNEMC